MNSPGATPLPTRMRVVKNFRFFFEKKHFPKEICEIQSVNCLNSIYDLEALERLRQLETAVEITTDKVSDETA